MKLRYLCIFLLVLLFLPALKIFAQTECRPPQIIFNKNSGNIFTEEQEMYLGEAMLERLQRNYRVIDDESVNAYLQSIGDRISRHLPPTNIKFSFVVVDTPDTNAYAMAGGRIFVTRKLISFARSEDELAGVIAHELGHGIVRHHALDISRYFKEILGVSRVGDRRDVFDKYNEFLEKARTKSIRFASNHMDDQQLEADRIGFYAMIAAGYDPEARVTYWKRLTGAKKQSFFSSFFSDRDELSDRRLTEMISEMKSVPKQCLEKRVASAKEDFEKWRVQVINFTGLGNKESFKSALNYRRSLIPLRSDIDHIRFSPNGEYILAQDNSGIAVLRREPLTSLFRIDIEDAMPAHFTPDSSTIVVYNRSMRVQKWNIAEKSLISTREVAVPRGFWQTYVSPDGNFLAAYQYSADLVLYDVATNEEIFREKQFYLPSYGEYLTWIFAMDILELNQIPVINIKFSPDGRYFLAGRKLSGGSLGKRESIMIDLQTKKEIPIESNIKKLLYTSFDFIAPDKIIGQYGDDAEKSGIFAFPSGERLDQFPLTGNSFVKAEKSDYVIVRPVVGAAVGVYDIKAKKYVLANKKPAIDMYENFVAAERKNGELAIYLLGKNEPVATLNLPASPFGNLRTWALSPDGNWLAVSDKSRGAVWNLQTGERRQHIRGFRGAYFAPDGLLYADFPKHGETARTIAAIDLKNNSITPGAPVMDKNLRQDGRYLVAMRSIDQKEEKEEKKKNEQQVFREEEREKGVALRDTIMEVRDAQTGATLWTRQFDDETPGRFISPTQNTMMLAWWLRSKAAKNIIKANPALNEKLAKMQEKDGDIFFQVLDPATGAIKGQFLLETGEGSFEIENAMAAGDYLMITDDQNRVLVYSISQDKLLHRFFGSRVAISAPANLIAIENVPGRIVVYDLTSGAERERLSFTKPISMLQFADEGKRMFVLTADQTAFFFDVMKFGTKQIKVF